MIPDKIYVLLDERTGFLSHTFTNVPCGYESSQDIEYIRKDALLEWAKEAHDSGSIKDSADKGDAWSIGYLCGMKDIIDKLNSL